MNRVALLALMAVCLVTAPVRAEVQRFAVLVGHNQGHESDAPLRYAESDAGKMHGVLRDLGGFHPANIVLLKSEDAATFRTTLISLNDRIRAAGALPNTQTMLLVYYSGHADANALRLGASRFDLTELGQLVRGSSATFRLLVVDACRSGALTRVKGGKVVAPFVLPDEPAMRGEGLAFLTASSANEDAQESDELKGSFFTHALVSGLLGAADTDRDGAVVLEEAYKYAYDSTLRATSRTWAGTQHPTFRYDFRGQDALVLTRLSSGGRQRAALTLPADVGFLVMKDHEGGTVVGEVGRKDSARTLSLRPGRYFLRGRGEDFLLEGTIALSSGARHSVDPDTLDRVEYARLVRKGERLSSLSHGPELGVALHSAIPGADGPCFGPFVGYRVELEHVGLVGRAGRCSSGYENATLSATTTEYDVTAAALHSWDLPWVTLGVGLGGGAAFTHQSFDTSGEAPSRLSTAPLFFAVGNAAFDVASNVYLGLDVRAETHLLDLQKASRDEAEATAAFTVRGGVAAGMLF